MDQPSENVNAWESDHDDVWGDDDNVSYDRAIAEKEWSRLHETFGNTGYREGIEEGKEGTLQQGFNQGWSEGVQYGHELGRLRGLISPLLEYVQSSAEKSSSICASKQISPEDLKQWIEEAAAVVKELVELDIAKVFDKAYFDDGRGPKSALSSEETASDNKSKSSEDGCCGGSKKGSQGDACCKSKTTPSPSVVAEEVEIQASESGSGCCGGKSAGSCSSSKANDAHSHKDGTILPSGLPAISSRPDQVLAHYKSRVRTLLKVFQMDSLVDLA
ncbi:hypothetical protein BG006_011129 [Podila minutissima]|uniref:Protein YAE1 n=1 Tax=Podila minutissima TaxID=64525 RepID=A0A9P5SC94_9FUNG|nr:hypothetical protein BG006_011129 [Podila minutissima]